MKNFPDALVAVLAGNAIYFLLMPHLPAVARHVLFKEDWGLRVDGRLNVKCSGQECPLHTTPPLLFSDESWTNPHAKSW